MKHWIVKRKNRKARSQKSETLEKRDRRKARSPKSETLEKRDHRKANPLKGAALEKRVCDYLIIFGAVTIWQWKLIMFDAEVISKTKKKTF